MKQGLFTVKENTALNALVYKMVLSGDTSAITKAGQFVNLQLAGKFLRRPISVCDVSDGMQIRRLATENNVTMFTSLDTVNVLLDVLEETTLTISTIDA